MGGACLVAGCKVKFLIAPMAFDAVLEGNNGTADGGSEVDGPGGRTEDLKDGAATPDHAGPGDETGPELGTPDDGSGIGTDLSTDAKAEADTDDAKAEADTDDAKVEADTDDAKVEADTDDAKAEADTDDAKAEADTDDAKVEADTDLETDADTSPGADPGTEVDAEADIEASTDPGGDADTGPEGSPPASPSARLSVGDTHACALTGAGEVKCWGRNSYLQLGKQTAPGDSSNQPLEVMGFGPGVVISAVSAGSAHTCALTSTGDVKCWGYGCIVLGDGLCANTPSALPKDVLELPTGVTAIAAGSIHTCVLTSSGGVKCWGYNDEGQLGTGTTLAEATPKDVVGLESGVQKIGRGYNHSGVITTSGGLKTWGSNLSGELGDGTQDKSLQPLDVSVLGYTVTEVVGWGNGATNHMCAIVSGNAVTCWGANHMGQIGNGRLGPPVLVPAAVSALPLGAITIGVGAAHSCAVLTDGSAMCWGSNWAGQIGNDTVEDTSAPAPVYGLSSGVVAISGGGALTCALMDTGGVKCWGDNLYGQLGNGTYDPSMVPVDVIGL
jgi:alpha-tubulin suppressor-like RCC1 family protein